MTQRTSRWARPPSAATVIVVWLVASACLAAGFRSNAWGLADQRQFERQNFDMEAHVVGRLVKSRQDGMLSAGGLLGLGNEDGGPIDWWDVPGAEQFEVYLGGGEFAAYEAYASHPGGQGILFSALDRLLGAPPALSLDVFRWITAILGGLAVGLIVAWFLLQFGPVTAGVVFLAALASPWLTVFGGKIFWALWAFYVPMLAAMFCLRGAERVDRRVVVRLGLLLCAAMFVKTLFTGFEFFTTTAVMAVVPVVFYAVRHEWSAGERRAAILVTAGALGFALALGLVVLLIQIGAARGSAWAGVEHVLDALRKRTYADPADYARMGHDVPVVDVLLSYLKGVWLDLNAFIRAPNDVVAWYLFRVQFAHLIAGFGLASVVLLWLFRRESDVERRRATALVAATWVSLVAPLSWFLLFKAHSAVHVGMNHIVWHMPFVLFGFAVVGFLVERGVIRAFARSRGAP